MINYFCTRPLHFDVSWAFLQAPKRSAQAQEEDA
jgi:hypothetical protein